jgi:hypothetical protein
MSPAPATAVAPRRRLSDAPAVDRRRWPRYRLGRPLPAYLTSDGEVHICEVVEVSLSGARLRVGGLPSHSGDLRLEAPGLGFVCGQREWTGELGTVGISFALQPHIADFIAGLLSASAGLPRSE